MSYRPPGEQFDRAVSLAEKLCSEINSVCLERINNDFDPYTQSHIEELYNLMKEVGMLRTKLRDI